MLTFVQKRCHFCIVLATKNVRKLTQNIASFLARLLDSILVPKAPQKAPHKSVFWYGGPPLRPPQTANSSKTSLWSHFGSILVPFRPPFWLNFRFQRWQGTSIVRKKHLTSLITARVQVHLPSDAACSAICLFFPLLFRPMAPVLVSGMQPATLGQKLTVQIGPAWHQIGATSASLLFLVVLRRFIPVSTTRLVWCVWWGAVKNVCMYVMYVCNVCMYVCMYVMYECMYVCMFARCGGS